jgi:K+-transporting ATPase KdpF subunit
MLDLVFVLVTVMFFVVSLGYISLLVSVGLLVYLTFALLTPEKF